MQTSRFQVGLSTVLALCLGYTLSSSLASGYPSGAISTGTNPVRSAAGQLELSSSDTVSGVMSAPSDQDLVLNDINLALTQAADYCRANGKVLLQDDAGTSYGVFAVNTTILYNAQATPTSFHGQSGIRIPAGTSLNLSWTWDYNYCSHGYYELAYTLGGYLAQP